MHHGQDNLMLTKIFWNVDEYYTAEPGISLTNYIVVIKDLVRVSFNYFFDQDKWFTKQTKTISWLRINYISYKIVLLTLPWIGMIDIILVEQFVNLNAQKEKSKI